MQKYIEKLLYCNIFCGNTIQYNTADLEYQYIANWNIYCYVLQYIASANDNLNAKLTKLN